MEITIKIDGNEAGGMGAGVQGGGVGEQGAVPGASQSAPAPAITAATQVAGAINAGPARIPAGQTGQPLADIGFTTQTAIGDGGGDPGTAAGAAPGFSEEPPAMASEEDAGEDSESE